MRRPDKNELIEIHRKMLGTFIENSEGINGMILVALRPKEDEGETAVEVYSAATQIDIYRGCAAILDAALGRGQFDDAREAKLVAKISDALLQLAGDDPEDVLGHGTGGLTEDQMDNYERRLAKKFNQNF